MLKRVWQAIPSGIVCLCVIFALFGYIGSIMGVPNMLNTIMKTAHDLLLNTVFYLMGICVITGAIGRLFVEFGVVSLLEKLLRPLMRPLFNLPGVASLGAVMTFLSDNPAIISLSQDKRFSSYFKKYQFISLTNFGTAFGMGLLVMVFMVGQGFYIEPLIGLFGAFVGCIVSTRLMQRKILKAYPQYAEEQVCDPHQVAFPITALGAVGASLGLIPGFMSAGWVDGNAIAVFTAIGMCWSGYLSTHTAMLDSLGYRELTSKAIVSHTIGGIAAGMVAHWTYVLVMLI